MTMDGERLTPEKVEEILKACRKQKFYVKALEETRAEILAQTASVKSMNYERPRVSSSAVSDIGAKLEAAQEKLRALDNKVADALSMQTALRDDAMQAIELCDNAVQKAVLTDYYVLGYEWEKIAGRTNYSERAIYNIRIAAIEAIAKNSHARNASKTVQ